MRHSLTLITVARVSLRYSWRAVSLCSALMLAPLAALQAAEKPLSDWQHLVYTETWTEKWPDASGKAETRKVTNTFLHKTCYIELWVILSNMVYCLN